MIDPALDNDGSSDAHLPWESIGETGDGIESDSAQQQAADEEQLPLTPWAREEQTAPDSISIEFGAAPFPAAIDEELADPPKFRRTSYTLPEPPPTRGGGWTLPLLCAGIALIACCVIIPQVDSNRRLAYERRQLQSELTNIQSQVKVNDEFLKRVADDPTLAQRLAERQMKVVPEGAHVLELSGDDQGMSPFQLVNVGPPPVLPPYKPLGGTLANICYGVHSRLYLIGISLGMIATGLVLGYAPQK